MLKKEIIGVVGPFSGPRACYGELLKALISQSALSQYTDILWYDDEASPIKGQEVALSLVQHNPWAIIGHFNSDSALAASSVYAAHQIPLLLPAATAMSLQVPFLYRICPNDLHQIHAIHAFITQHALHQYTVWSDQSTYGDRLKTLLNQHSISRLEDRNASAIVLFGAHYRIAEYILNYQDQLQGKILLCCDDCAIHEFETWMQDMPHLYIARPIPTFSQCVSLGIECLLAYLQSNRLQSFSEWLTQHPPFMNLSGVHHQNPQAYFAIECLGHSSK